MAKLIYIYRLFLIFLCYLGGWAGFAFIWFNFLSLYQVPIFVKGFIIICCLLINAFLLQLSHKMQEYLKLFKRYRKAIDILKKTSIEAIADYLQIPYRTALNDLRKMIKQKLFTDFFIDGSEKNIIFIDRALPASKAKEMAADSKDKAIIVVCKSCGAENVVLGRGVRCEYCGKPLKVSGKPLKVKK